MIKVILLFSIFLSCSAISSLTFYECDRSKACFKTSKDCTIDTCEFGITWKAISFNNVNFIEFELVGNVYSENGYILLGFSEDKSLGNDGLVGCLVENNEVKVISGYYGESDGISLNFIPFISDKDRDFIIKKDGDHLGGTFNQLTKRIFCRFRRRATPKSFIVQLKDLGAGKKYYLLTLRGTKASEFDFEKLIPGSVLFSNEVVDFSVSSFYALSGSSTVDSKLAKCHGIFMIIAWILCSSVGIITARYYKNVWPSTIKSRETHWFQVHRVLQSLCVILTSIGIILISIHVKGYSRLDTFPYSAHPILGIIVFILMFMNPLLALCRCKPTSSSRPWFNWIHFFIGTVAYCLSVPTIMIGMKLPAAGQAFAKLNFPQWILIVFVIFQFVIEIILEIHECFYYNKNKNKQHVYEREIVEFQMALISHQEPSSLPVKPQQSGRMFKKVIFGIHCVVSILVVVTLVVIIVTF